MAQYFSPGVYVEEYDHSPRSIEGVGTSTAGFIGLAEKGQTAGQPVHITSYRNFVKEFGEPLSAFSYGEYRYLAPCVEQFFANGGSSCYVARVLPPGAETASVKAGILSIEAASEGKWGNRIQVTVNMVTRRKMQLVGKNGDSYIAKSVEGFREGDTVAAGEEYNRIKSIIDNSVVFEQSFVKEVVDTALIPSTCIALAEMDVSVRYGDEAESYRDVSLNSASPNYIGYRLADSGFVRVAAEPLENIGSPAVAILGEGSTGGMFLLEGGKDGVLEKVTAGTFLGEDNGPGKRTGLLSFEEISNVSLMAVPGITIPEVVVSLVGQCENLKDRFAVIDMPQRMCRAKDLLAYREMVDSSYAAMYHPWIQVFDRSSNQPEFIPPSGAVMGVYSRTDANRGVHKAPANETVFCTGLQVNYTRAEQDVLNPAGINLIRAIPGQGIRIWGARTAGSAGNFKYVNVRRLFIFVEESIRANTSWVVFEPNDAALWQRVRITVSGFLDNLWRTGMLAGASASEAYFIEIGSSTMSRDDIMNGRLICNIGIAPSRPAEFVVFRVTQHTSEASAAV